MLRPIRYLFFALFLLWSGPALPQERGALVLVPTDTNAPTTLYSKSYALVIGIDGYTGGWPRLSNAINDAKAVAKTLQRHGFAVTLVVNPKANELKVKFEDFIFAKGADPEARLFIWFAGHGHTLDGEGYLVPADGPLPNAGWKFRRQSFSLRSFGRLMREAKSKHVLAVFDSCFAGTVFMTARALPSSAITRATALPVRQFVSSGEAEQEVSDDGMFRKLFIAALDGNEPLADANRDGYVTGTELGLFLSDKVTNLTGNRQTPRYGKLRALGLDRGNFVFKVQSNVPGPNQSVQTCSASEDGRARQLYQKITGSRSRNQQRIRQLELVVHRYPGCDHAALAQIDLDALRVEIAALSAVPQGPGDNRKLEQISDSLDVRLQKMLQATGCYAGKIDGNWGPKSRLAVKAFAARTQTTITDPSASLDLAKIISERVAGLKKEGRASPVCQSSCSRGFRLELGGCVEKPIIASGEQGSRATKGRSVAGRATRRTRSSACEKYKSCLRNDITTPIASPQFKLSMCGGRPSGCN